MDFSLEDGAIGHRLGNLSIANIQHFYPDENATYIPGGSEQGFMAKMYTDISLSYTETNAQNLGPENEYQLEDLGNGWRYHVCLASPIPLSDSPRRVGEC